MPFLRVMPACLLALFLVIGCQSDEPATEAVEMLDPPVAPGSGQPHLHVDDRGALWMSWIEPVGEDRHALRYASYDGASWMEPGTIATGGDWFVNWADVPSLRTLPGERLAAHFLVSNGPNIFGYDVRITQTASDGNWQETITPHRDRTETEHGFASLLPWEEDLLAVWLDGREMELGSEDDGHDHGSGNMTLRSAVIDSTGALKRQDLLDDRVCECCPTSAVRTEEGALVAYRDRSDEEIRNIGLIRFDGEAWSDPYLLHDDGWQIEGCPVNGPALAARGNRVVAAWFAAANDEPLVRAAFSDDGGRTFSTPVLIDDDRPAGQVDAVLLDDGSAIVSWHGRDASDTALRIRQVFDDETMTPTTTVATPMPPVRAGIPRMVRNGDDLYFAWVDVDEDDAESQVRLARASGLFP